MSKREGDPGYAGGWCIHYRHQAEVKTEYATCEAGVKYVDLNGGLTLGVFKDAPCFLINGQPRPGSRHCDKLRLPTPEEIAAHDQWADGLYARLVVVRVAIRPWREAHKGKSAAEIIECPICTGKLHLSIAAYNGHVHGKCETPGCVEWRE